MHMTKLQPWWENDCFVWTLAIDVAFFPDSWYWSLLSAFCTDFLVLCGCILKLGSHGHSCLLVCVCEKILCLLTQKRLVLCMAWDACAIGGGHLRAWIERTFCIEMKSSLVLGGWEVFNPSFFLIFGTCQGKEEVKFISAPKKPMTHNRFARTSVHQFCIACPQVAL